MHFQSGKPCVEEETSVPPHQPRLNFPAVVSLSPNIELLNVPRLLVRIAETVGIRGESTPRVTPQNAKFIALRYGLCDPPAHVCLASDDCVVFRIVDFDAERLDRPVGQLFGGVLRELKIQ